MRILFLAHRVPFPPNKGDKIRAFNEIVHLSQRHEVHLIAFCDNPGDMRFGPELQKYCCTVALVPLNSQLQKWKALLSILTLSPWTLGYFQNSQMAEVVRRKLSQVIFDFIMVYSSSMAQYVERVKSVPKILDFVDSDAAKWRQYSQVKKLPIKLLYKYEAGRLKRYEARLIQSFDKCVFVSPREADDLPQEVAGTLLFVPNGIDLEVFRRESISQNSRDIIFTGAMDYFPNIDAVAYFASKLLPQVRQKVPDARFVIVGSRPDPRVLRLTRLAGVTVTGTVPDVRPYLQQSRVAVAPLRISQGIQNKVLEALAVGLPVVASIPAAAGLTMLSTSCCAVAADDQQFVHSVVKFLQQPPLSNEEVGSCLKQLREHYDWAKNMSLFESVIENGLPARVELGSLQTNQSR